MPRYSFMFTVVKRQKLIMKALNWPTTLRRYKKRPNDVERFLLTRTVGSLLRMNAAVASPNLRSTSTNAKPTHDLPSSTSIFDNSCHFRRFVGVRCARAGGK